MKFVFRAFAALMIGAICRPTGPAFAMEAPPFTREGAEALEPIRQLSLRYRLSEAGQFSMTSHEIIEIRDQHAVRAFARFNLSRRSAGGPPERFVARQWRKDTKIVHTIARSRLPDNAPVIIHFPDLQLGDRLEIETERLSLETPLGGVALARSFAAHQRYRQIEIQMSAPKNVAIQTEARGFGFKRQEVGENRILTWILGPQPYREREPGLVHPFERAPLFAASTFPDYAAYASGFEAAYRRLDWRAPVPDLARTIAGDVDEPAQIAHRLAQWLRETITIHRFSLNVAVPPVLSPAQVIESKSGSVFDVAMLFRAMLAARGVQSTLILTNRRAIFADPGLALGMFNAALVEVPAIGEIFDLAEPAADANRVALIYAGKFALRLSTDGPAQTFNFAVPPASENRLEILAELTIDASGDVQGQSRTTGQGPQAALLRQVNEAWHEEGPEAVARSLLARQNLGGSVRIQPTTAPTGSGFAVDLAFRLAGRAEKDGVIWVPLNAGPRLLRLPVPGFLSYLRDDVSDPLVCAPQTYSNDLVFHLPDSALPLRLPRNVEINQEGAHYSARYQAEGTTLRIIRRLTIEPPPGPCSRQFVLHIAPVLRAAQADLNSRLVLRGETD